MQFIRKITTIITACLFLSLLSSCLKDPCFESQCFGDGCEDGICECEDRNWSYIRWNAVCISCSNTTDFVIVLEVEGVKIKETTLRGNKWATFSNIRIPGEGVKPYRIYTKPSYYYSDSGNLNLIRCEETTFETRVP